ncbi:helix-turn-helix domain-containing protein [Actinoplanes bogorensis]|uniref:Helix-turn-helix domain-containing protein n=1 Tax=Paractinoplanes bogorensis TaxID=1610840 RepID=A0ABS5Z0T0_9ACTN|nr:helix-turn-helix transcriptional regulator [Actinoplanes bogorensis]MBU2669298.1 helix-turn-helix domain-containing protein [Actinoplanes bogorensis]
MDNVDRVLSPAVVEALTFWPRLTQATGVDVSVLVPFFNELLGEWPFWDSRWRVTRAGHAYPYEIAKDEERSVSRFTEVSVPGEVGHDDGRALPWVARVRFTGDRLVRFEAKVGAAVIGPALTEPGRPEPNPFGAVLTRLMEARGLTRHDMAVRCRRAQSTIVGVMRGASNPHRILLTEMAAALEMPEADLLAIAGQPDAESAAGRPQS